MRRCVLRAAGAAVVLFILTSAVWLVLDGGEDEEPARGSGAAHAARKARIGLLILGDSAYQRRYASQIKSLRCYANRHGYDLHLLGADEYSACWKYWKFFFRKHCAVAEFLGETQPPGYVLAVLDADSVAVALERGLERWADHDADVQLYMRCVLPELAAGNYIVRNTPFARAFLRRWAEFNFLMPLGFSSYDNGAIHPHVVDTLQLSGRVDCWRAYRGLASSIPGEREYFNFTQVCTDAIGPPRDWSLPDGKLTVWPRLNFFVVDGAYLSKKASNEMGPVVHHGIKDWDRDGGHYYKDLRACAVNEAEALVGVAEARSEVLRVGRGYKDYFQQGADCAQCVERCLGNFSCRPLADGEAPVPNRTATEAFPEPPLCAAWAYLPPWTPWLHVRAALECLRRTLAKACGTLC